MPGGRGAKLDRSGLCGGNAYIQCFNKVQVFGRREALVPRRLSGTVVIVFDAAQPGVVLCW